MKGIKFDQSNCMLAENQPEYETLPVFMETKEVLIPVPGKEACAKRSLPWSMTACFELSDEEISEIVKTRKLWYTQMLFGQNFQPVSMSTQNPFINAESDNVHSGT